VSTVVAPPRRRTVLRFWLPLTVIVVLLAADAVVLAWPPSDSLSRSIRFFLSVILVGLAVIVALWWWFFLSGIRWPLRVVSWLVLAAAIAGAFYSIDEVQLDGDMVPVYTHLRWQPTRAQLLQEYRQTHPGGTAAVTLSARDASPDDYPCYRNTARDGVVVGPPLARNWKNHPPRELWKKPCGAGFAGFSVVAGRAVTIEQRGGDEAVVCYNAATGDEVWSHSYPARFYDARGGEGPMATPTIDRGLVFSLGGTGRLVCLDLATGESKWTVDLLNDGQNLIWGMSGSPLVYDDVVVVNPGGQKGRGDGQALVALDRKTGERVWGVGSTQAGYSSPMLAKFADTRQIVIFDGQEVAGYDNKGKAKLWSLPWITNMGINVAEPLALADGRVFVTSGYGVGCGLLHVTKDPKDENRWTADEVARAKTMQGKFASPVEFSGQIYGLSEGTLTCIDEHDLARVWTGRRYGHGQLLRCEDLLVILSEAGELALVHAAGAKSRELGSVKVLAGDKTWNYPCLAGGKAYVRNHVEMACYDLRE
jgi:outer membrane protein assembly factor BamB